MTSKSVLVIEDDIDIRKSLLEALREGGFTVRAASNGKEALESMRKDGLPALILLDLMMPIMNGWQFRLELRQIPEFAKIPVVVLSADNSIQQKASAVGADGFLRKPIELDELFDVVKRYCE